MTKTIDTDRSSNVKTVSYNDETSDMEITFKNDTKYVYREVPEKIFESMTRADSVGKYFITNVRNHYKFTKI